MFMYDGKSGEKICELTQAENSHTGGIFSLAWSPDSKSLLTASADMTAKLWDIATQKAVMYVFFNLFF